MSRDPNATTRIGIVVIGRNEGDRLARCLESLADGGSPVVYVDSASSDGSVELARGYLSRVLQLDDHRPLSAARARNEGFEALMREFPATEFVQFVDGDCVVEKSWLSVGPTTMADDPSISALAGVLREHDPQRSVYNRLCDLEWSVPPGEAEHCGGIFLCRASAFREAGGFDETLIAGEEPDLCRRLRSLGGRIVRVDAPMATHDAAMTSFAQWWRRTVRGGQGTAALAARANWRHPTSRRAVLSSLFWGLAVPTVAGVGLLGALWFPWSLALTALSAVALLATIIRIVVRKVRTGVSIPHAVLYATFCMIAKPAQVIGYLRWLRNNSRQRPDCSGEPTPASEHSKQHHRVR